MSAYGLWSLVIINATVFIFFAFSFVQPRTRRDWRSFGAFSAFILALFTEMYGFPLTIYLLSGWLSHWIPAADLYSHNGGHLWHTLLGLKGNAHSGPVDLLGDVLILGGFALLASAWNVLYKSQREHRLAVIGPYAHLRHPQYLGFILIVSGFLLQWPTMLTLIMFPILICMYIRLARHEEREALAEFGEVYKQYAAFVPAFIPRLHSALPKPAAVLQWPKDLKKKGMKKAVNQ